ncbi:hypothetical protein ACHAWO_009765 [Cyclotella atomus]|uniref:Uncharacterized protein n=1 Tax=Cyclotella atomus TaxID=382360 RepID=A0ABD3NIY2_9STRA
MPSLVFWSSSIQYWRRPKSHSFAIKRQSLSKARERCRSLLSFDVYDVVSNLNQRLELREVLALQRCLVDTLINTGDINC